jgi:hypothetical protein
MKGKSDVAEKPSSKRCVRQQDENRQKEEAAVKKSKKARSVPSLEEAAEIVTCKHRL